MPNLLIAGATGGVGSALLDQLGRNQAPPRLFATARQPTGEQQDNLRWLPLDFTQDDSPARLAQQLSDQCDALDTLICATGYLHGDEGDPEKSLGRLTPETMAHVHRVNAFGPLLLLSACEKLLKNADRPRVMILSAQVGSIGDNKLGGWYSYRMAKAALNMGVRTAAIEAARWRNGAAIVAVHPGTTRSALAEPFIANRKAPVSSAAETAERLLTLHDRLTADDNGRFLTSRGETLPW